MTFDPKQFNFRLPQTILDQSLHTLRLISRKGRFGRGFLSDGRIINVELESSFYNEIRKEPKTAFATTHVRLTRAYPNKSGYYSDKPMHGAHLLSFFYDDLKNPPHTLDPFGFTVKEHQVRILCQDSRNDSYVTIYVAPAFFFKTRKTVERPGSRILPYGLLNKVGNYPDYEIAVGGFEVFPPKRKPPSPLCP